MVSTGFGSEFASRCSHVCTRWLLNTCLPTANPSPASLAVATCDRLTVVISISHMWDLLRTEDVHLHTPALRIGTHFLLTLEIVVFLFHLLSTTSKSFSSLSTRLAHAAGLGFFYKNALYKFTVIIINIISEIVCDLLAHLSHIGCNIVMRQMWLTDIFGRGGQSSRSREAKNRLGGLTYRQHSRPLMGCAPCLVFLLQCQ